MLATGFTNSFTSGEIGDDAWDRVELQPIAKGCQLAQNLVIRIAGPLGKRRGFWLIAGISDQAHPARLIPFRKSPTDAFVLEFGNNVCHVWTTDGAPLLNPGPGAQVSFATPYTAAQLAGLRFKQVADVIYFRSSAGLAPQALQRTSGGIANADWTFNAESFQLGPWLSENIDLTSTVTFTNTAGPADILDTNPATSAGVIPAGATVTIAASQAIFAAGMVGAYLRVRANLTSVSSKSWSPGTDYRVGNFVTSVGNMYLVISCLMDKSGSNPPVQLEGNQSDGDSVFQFLHDGAGIVEISGFTDTQHVTGTVIHAVPVQSAVATSYWAFGAYSAYEGWPSAWPEIREERLVEGATASNLDWVDLTQTAGFAPTSEDFTPGTGLGVIVDTNAIRRRLGTDGGQVIWFSTATYLLGGTTGGVHLIAGSVLDEPLSPSAITIKDLNAFACADAAPARAHKGLLYIVRGNQTLREINIDTQQGAETEDHSYLATHLAARNFEQLAWVADPDNNCWIRLGDGGYACFTYHQEQGVKGFTTQALGGGLTVLDEIVMPGPGGFETLWVLASQPKPGGGSQTLILQQSQVTDKLFMDAAQAYAGAAVPTIGGLGLFNGQAMDVLDTAKGAWFPALTPAAGDVTLPGGATTTAAQVGFTYPVEFISLKLDLRIFNGALLQRQRVTAAIVDVKTALCTVSGDGVAGETLDARTAADVPGVTPKRYTREFTIETTGDTETGDRDPRIVITEQTPFDFVLYAIKSNVNAGQ